ncbi:MAG TPA: hypothetical protein VGL97_07080 [Bryobacteraceae bacterium]
MTPQPTKGHAGPDEIVAAILHRTSKDDLKRLVESATAASGTPTGKVGFEPGDEICPTFVFPFPLPPKFNGFLQTIAQLGGISEVFPLGLLNPEQIVVQTRMPAVG